MKATASHSLDVFFLQNRQKTGRKQAAGTAVTATLDTQNNSLGLRDVYLPEQRVKGRKTESYAP